MYNYTYNADGIRTSKTVYDASGDYVGATEYIYDGTKLIAENRSGDWLYYFYDVNGTVSGISYNGTLYYFRKNLQGDVTGIYNAYGNIIAQYEYTPYGALLAVTDANGNDISANATHVANINPFRYRGYYYDTDTGFYYLQTRYYDPEVGRFINADDVSMLGADGSPLSYNLFTYCYNNTVNMADDTGYLPFFVITGIAGALIGGVIGYAKTGSWKGALGGAAIGGVIGLTGGAGAAKLLAGSAIATTGMVIAGGKAIISAAGIISQADKILQKVGDLYRSLTKWNFRYNLQQLTGNSGTGMEAHHIFPQKFIDLFSKAGINIHNPLYGSWVDPTLHKSWSQAYNKAWEAFFNTIKKPTVQQIFNKVSELAEQYGFILNWEVKK